MILEEVVLSPAEKYAAWSILVGHPSCLKLGKYMYVGMNHPKRMPREWYEVDAHLLGMLTERGNTMLHNSSKQFIELFILGDRYKAYRRSLKQLIGQ
jgi:hypothetical protein